MRTESVRPHSNRSRWLAWGFGAGITRDLINLYSRLIQTWRPGDRIYLFGFSRGAFTIRLFAFILFRCGVANIRPNDKLMRPEQIERLAKEAIGAFKLRHTGADERFRALHGYCCQKIADGCDDSEAWRKAAGTNDSLNGKGRVPIRFIGVWDTVDAVGLPFDNMSQFFLIIVRWITKLPFMRWLKAMLLLNLARRRPLISHCDDQWKNWGDDDDLHPCIEAAYHAMAIDDERKTFHPVLWMERKSDGKDKKHADDTLLTQIEQVWFAGAHANVGGGYPKDHLAHVPLEWMMRHATNCGLVFDADKFREYGQERDEFGKLYDSRSGGGVFYRYMPRAILDLSREVGLGDADRKPLIHESVLIRVKGSTSAYAPVGAPGPDMYEVASDPPIQAVAEQPEDDGHFELSWSGQDENQQKLQQEARSFSQQNARRLTDLRLCCYYAFCVWVVAFIVTGAVRSHGDGASGSSIGVPQSWSEYLALFDKPVNKLFGPGELLTPYLSPFFSWTLALILGLCALILALTVAVFSIVVAIGFLKGFKAFLPDDNGIPISLKKRLQTKPKPHNVWFVLIVSVAVGVVTALLQPLVQGAFLLATPQAVEELLRGVLDSRGLVAFSGFAMAGIVQVSRICKTRIREWSVFGWKTSLPGENPIGPVPSYWEQLGKLYRSTSWQGVFLERIALPVSAMAILLAAGLVFSVTSINDNQSPDATPAAAEPAKKR